MPRRVRASVVDDIVNQDRFAGDWYDVVDYVDSAEDWEVVRWVHRTYEGGWPGFVDLVKPAFSDATEARHGR